MNTTPKELTQSQKIACGMLIGTLLTLSLFVMLALAQSSGQRPVNTQRPQPNRPSLNLPAGARSFTDPSTGKTYVALPGRGNRDQQFANASNLVPSKSYAFVPSSPQEFEKVWRGLDFPTLDMYAVGIYRLDGAPKTEPLSFWTTVTGEPILINQTIWNPDAPNNGCKTKPKIGIKGTKLVIDNGPHCKNEYSCGIYNALGGNLRGRLEDLGRGATFNGVIVEINR
jgi:hypothetical protein